MLFPIHVSVATLRQKCNIKPIAKREYFLSGNLQKNCHHPQANITAVWGHLFCDKKRFGANIRVWTSNLKCNKITPCTIGKCLCVQYCRREEGNFWCGSLSGLSANYPNFPHRELTTQSNQSTVH
jgi:hypothetical protein